MEVVLVWQGEAAVLFEGVKFVQTNEDGFGLGEVRNTIDELDDGCEHSRKTAENFRCV